MYHFLQYTFHFFMHKTIYIVLTYCPLLEEGGVETGGGPWVLGPGLQAAFDVTVAVWGPVSAVNSSGGCQHRYIWHS